MAVIVSKLPKDAKKGSKYSIKKKGRIITFQCTGKKGFGKWKILSNKKQ